MPSEVFKRDGDDPHPAGVTFVDLLFAIAVGKYLDVVASKSLTAVDWFNLAVGVTLLLGSWIGYHNSLFRVAGPLRFWNSSLRTFLIDVALVVDYWILPAKFIGSDPGQATRAPESMAVATVVAVAFALYAVWDWLGPDTERTQEHALTRQKVSYVAAWVTGAVWLLVVLLRPSTESAAIGVDIFLLAVLVVYRTAKETKWRESAEARERD